MRLHADIQRVQFVGGPLDGEEIELEEDIYEQLLDSPIYVYKLTRKK